MGVATEVAEIDVLGCPDAFRSDPPRRWSGVVSPHDYAVIGFLGGWWPVRSLVGRPTRPESLIHGRRGK